MQEKDIILQNNPLYKLIDTQSTRFEEFRKRMSTQLNTFYQECNKQRQNETFENNLIGYEKIIEKYQTQIDSQSELIESLVSRIKNLEISSNEKDQDIKKLREDFKDFLKFIK